MPITYDEDIKEPGLQFEYTTEQMKEIWKCQNNFEHFASFMKIISLDEGEIPFKLYEYQKTMIDMFTDNRFSVILSSRQSRQMCL